MSKLDQTYDKYEKKMKSGGMACYIESGDGKYQWLRESGNMVNGKRYGIASVSKLFTTVLILNLVDEGTIKLTDPIKNYLPEHVMSQLHVRKGIDYSNQITIKNLLAQTSGLPDYYTETLKGDLETDEFLPDNPEDMLEQILIWNKKLKPKFSPLKENKAYYSDLNFDLLGLLVEIVTKRSFRDNLVKYMIEPLQLHETDLLHKDEPYDFPGIYLNGKIIRPRNILLNSPASGGVLSTIKETMIFLKAFWQGKLFSPEHLPFMKVYHYLQFIPMQYGVGHMRFKQPGFPEIIGHTGSTGVIAYYMPKYDTYITGVINECNESKVIRIAAQLLLSCNKDRKK